MRKLWPFAALMFVVVAATWSPASAAPPTVTLSRPSAGATLSGTPRLDVATSADTARVYYFADGVEVAHDFTASTFDEPWDTTTVPDGDYTLHAEAINTIGEIGVSPPIRVTVRNTPPSTTTTTSPPSTTTTSTTTTSTSSTTTTTLSPTTTTTVSTPPSTDCEQAGWLRIESQSWWWQPSLGPDREGDARHVHGSACIPTRDRTLSGIVPIRFDVKLHNAAPDSTVYYLAIVVKTDTLERSFSINPGWRCASRDCSFSHMFMLDTSKFDQNGLQEIRLRTSLRQPDLGGQEIRQSLNFQVGIDNGTTKARNDVDRMPWLRGKGWYTDLFYCEAGFRDDLTPLPTQPVSGLWTINLRQVDHDAGDAPVTRHTVRVDPDIHHGWPGTILTEGQGEREGTFTVDTRQLPNGSHKLMVQSECEGSAEGTAGINSGILVIPFTVQN